VLVHSTAAAIAALQDQHCSSKLNKAQPSEDLIYQLISGGGRRMQLQPREQQQSSSKAQVQQPSSHQLQQRATNLTETLHNNPAYPVTERSGFRRRPQQSNRQ
jgi:hypothetical protein